MPDIVLYYCYCWFDFDYQKILAVILLYPVYIQKINGKL